MVYEPSTERELDIIKNTVVMLLAQMEILEWPKYHPNSPMRIWYERLVQFDHNLADEAYWGRNVPS